MLQWTILTAIAAGCFLIIHVDSCNEAVCGSIVSKCLLTQSCKCDLKNCTCCRECYSCLSYRYSECCSCVDMCPKPNDSATVTITKQSYVEDFTETVPGLFQVLTEQPDPEDRWLSITFGVDIDLLLYAPKKDMKLQLQSSEQESVSTKPNATTINCTVAFMSQCMSWSKCRNNCQSMGASSFRWFHNGCCECVGNTCINYGIKEAKCLNCSVADIDSQDEYNWDTDEDLYDEENYDDDDVDVAVNDEENTAN